MILRLGRRGSSSPPSPHGSDKASNMSLGSVMSACLDNNSIQLADNNSSQLAASTALMNHLKMFIYY